MAFSFGASSAPQSAFGVQPSQQQGSFFGPQRQQPSSVFGSQQQPQQSSSTLFGGQQQAAFGPVAFPQPDPGGILLQTASNVAHGLQSVIEDTTRLALVVSGPELYGDERDGVVSKLNQFLAAVGTGKGYYHSSQLSTAQPATAMGQTALPAYDFKIDNVFHRLKGVAYNRLSQHRNADGMVSIVLAVNAIQIESSQQRQKAIDAVNALLRKPQSAPTLSIGAAAAPKQSITVHAELKSIIPLGDNLTEIVVCVREYGRGIWPATQLYGELKRNEESLKQSLSCVGIVPRVEVPKKKMSPPTDKLPPGQMPGTTPRQQPKKKMSPPTNKLHQRQPSGGKGTGGGQDDDQVRLPSGGQGTGRNHHVYLAINTTDKLPPGQMPGTTPRQQPKKKMSPPTDKLHQRQPSGGKGTGGGQDDDQVRLPSGGKGTGGGQDDDQVRLPSGGKGTGRQLPATTPRRRKRKSAEVPDYQKGPCHCCDKRFVYWRGGRPGSNIVCQACKVKSIHDAQGLSDAIKWAEEHPDEIDLDEELREIKSYNHYDVPPRPPDALLTPEELDNVVDLSTASEEMRERAKTSYRAISESRSANGRALINLYDPTPEWEVYYKRPKGAEHFDEQQRPSFGVTRDRKKRGKVWNKRAGAHDEERNFELLPLITHLPLASSYTFEFGTRQLFDKKRLDQIVMPSPVVPYRLNAKGEKEYLPCEKLRKFCAAVVIKVGVLGGRPIKWTKSDEDTASDKDSAASDEDSGEDVPPPTKRRRLD